MPRPTKCRKVSEIPKECYFKPAGIPMSELEEINLLVEELEAIRLKDLEGLNQEECAQRMHISRPTFQRVLTKAREKIAIALVQVKAIKVEGGNFHMTDGFLKCSNCKRWIKEHKNNCPKCGHNFEEKS